MIDWLSAINGVIGGGMLMLMTMGLWTASIMPGMDRWTRRFFMILFAVLVVLVILYFADTALYGRPEMLVPQLVVYFGETLLMSFPMVIFPVYLLHSCNESMRGSMLLRAVFVLWLVFVALLAISENAPFFYRITPDNLFYRGPGYWIILVPIVALMILNLVSVIRRRNKLPKKHFRASLIYLTPLTIALIIHMFFSAFALIDVGIVISAFSMYLIVLTEQIEQYLHQQREIARQRASIAVLQMRPHFIYNTMTSIYYLCEQDPKVAQQVTLDFTTYLRRNLAAIASDDTIPFSEELEHTRAYLAVEQAQFEDMLFVDYDIRHTQFRIPPLTLQPIVENAVKHSLDPDSEPLRISITTRKSSAGSMLIVSNNGAVFDPAIADDPHTTLANIRQRLELMCNGKLTIVSNKDYGTVVSVTIP